jgi:ABC-2 type transport system ATP-binding protein
MNIIETKSLTKYYGNRRGINDLNFNVPENSMYGFLGCNGAGKTTTIGILSGLIIKTSGKVIIDNKDLDKQGPEMKQIIGSMPQNMELNLDKTVCQNMFFYAYLKGMEKLQAQKEINSLLTEFGILDLYNLKVNKLSYGQTRFLLIAQAFLNNPKLVLLDEPLAGLDPKKMIVLRNFLKRRNGIATIVISSHNLDEVDRICTHIGIIHEGRMILQGEKKRIKKGMSLEQVFLKNI